AAAGMVRSGHRACTRSARLGCGLRGAAVLRRGAGAAAAPGGRQASEAAVAAGGHRARGDLVRPHRSAAVERAAGVSARHRSLPGPGARSGGRAGGRRVVAPPLPAGLLRLLADGACAFMPASVMAWHNLRRVLAAPAAALLVACGGDEGKGPPLPVGPV